MHALLGNGEIGDLFRKDTWLYTVVGRSFQALSTFLRQVRRDSLIWVSVNWHTPLMISVKKNRWTALSKALGPFLYGFNSCPWASYSRGRDGAWFARSLIPVLKEDEREACSAWEQAEFDIRQREMRGERGNEWRAAAIRGCKPTTRLNLEYMEVGRTGGHVHVVCCQSNSSKNKPMSSATAKAKAKTKAPALSDQGMYLAHPRKFTLNWISQRSSKIIFGCKMNYKFLQGK